MIFYRDYYYILFFFKIINRSFYLNIITPNFLFFLNKKNLTDKVGGCIIMPMQHVDGKNEGKLVLYALSTCGWCRKTRMLLEELNVEYDYIYVDLLEGDERNEIIEQVKKWNSREDAAKNARRKPTVWSERGNDHCSTKLILLHIQ